MFHPNVFKTSAKDKYLTGSVGKDNSLNVSLLLKIWFLDKNSK